MRSKIYDSINEIRNLRFSKTKLKLIMYSVLIGLITGVIVVFYRLSIDKFVHFREVLIDKKDWDLVILVLFFISVLIIQTLLRFLPLISGSGIPQVMGLLKGACEFNWFFELIAKFVGGILGIFMGMSLGREGPSIHLGALIADGINKITKRADVEKKYLITAGGSAGLSAAFNAPLSGTIFALEELHKFFSPLMLICTMVASICANFVVQYVLGRSVVFNKFDFTTPFKDNLSSLGLELLLIFGLAILLSVAGAIFNKVLISSQKTYKKININPYIKMICFAVVLFLITKFLPQISGGGHSLIEQLVLSDFSFKFIIVLLIGKFILTEASYSTGTPGGIFLPLLVIGSLIGKAYGLTVAHIFHLNNAYVVHFMLLSMAGYFAAIVKSPITGTVLVLELTGNFSNLFPLTITSAMTYILSELLRVEPVYELLYENMFSTKKNKKVDEHKKKKVGMRTYVIPVVSSSYICDKLIKQVMWPKNMLIVGIIRMGIEFIPNGNTKIFEGDKIIIFTDNETATNTLKTLYGLSAKETLDEDDKEHEKENVDA